MKRILVTSLGRVNAGAVVASLRKMGGVEILGADINEAFCRDFAEAIDLNGVVNVEFFLAAEGLKVIEVNPRLPAGTSYNCLAGFDIVRYAYEIGWGEVGGGMPTDKTRWVGHRFARRYETVEM